MEMIKKVCGWGLVIWGAYRAGETIGWLFFPEVFADERIVADLQNMLANASASFLFKLIIEDVILPNILPIVIGVALLRIPSSRIKAFAVSAKARFTSTYEEAKTKAPTVDTVTPPPQSTNYVSTWAKLGIALGCTVLAYAFFMDVSVEVSYGRSVVNLDLISRRQTLVILGALIVVCGVAFLLVSRSQSLRSTSDGIELAQPETFKECPQCAELIKVKAVKCRFCHFDLKT